MNYSRDATVAEGLHYTAIWNGAMIQSKVREVRPIRGVLSRLYCDVVHAIIDHISLSTTGSCRSHGRFPAEEAAKIFQVIEALRNTELAASGQYTRKSLKLLQGRRQMSVDVRGSGSESGVMLCLHQWQKDA